MTLLEALVGENQKAKRNRIGVRPQQRTSTETYAWLLAVLLSLLASIAVILGSHFILKNFKPGIAVVVFRWASLLGGTALLSFSSKVLTALFGGLIGVGSSEISTGFSGLIDKASQQIAVIAEHISKIAGPAASSYNEFIGWMVWLLVIVVALFCLPAFFTE